MSGRAARSDGSGSFLIAWKVASGYAPRNGTAPGQHLEHHDAERPDVAARVGLFAARLLRRHVGDGADRRSRNRQLQRVGELRQAEVENLHAVVGDDQVAGLDVAMDDALRVRFGEPLGDLRGDLDRLGDGSGPRSSFCFSVSPS